MKLKMYKRFILGKIGELCKFIWYTLEFQYENQLHLIYRHFILLLNPLVMSFLPRLLARLVRASANKEDETS